MTLIRVVQEPSFGDACPLCGVTLGRARGATRRQIVLSPRPGLFCWRCPDCRGTWAVRSVRHAPGEDLEAPTRRRPRAAAPPEYPVRRPEPAPG